MSSIQTLCARLPVLALAILALAGNGCRQNKEPTESNTNAQDSDKVPVTVTTVRTRGLRETVRGIGSLRALETVELRPEISGVLEKRPVTDGERIHKEQLLFELDDAKLQRELAARKAALEAARARRENAERTYRRMETLLERRSVSEDERDQARTAFETARAEVARLEAEVALTEERLEDTQIRAPFDGVLDECRVDPGDYVQIGQHMVTLYRTDIVEIAFSVPERHMGRVRRDQPVDVTVDAYPERTFEGGVTFVSPSIDEVTRDFLVKARIDNAEGLLKPGAFATGVLTLVQHEERPVVPEEALVPVRDGYIVYTLSEERAHRQRVRIGLREPGIVEIREGVEPGQRVVRTGHMNLSEGVPVRIRGNGGDSRPEEPDGRSGS